MILEIFNFLKFPPFFPLWGGVKKFPVEATQWEKGGNSKNNFFSKITRYNVYGLELDDSKRNFEVILKID